MLRGLAGVILPELPGADRQGRLYRALGAPCRAVGAETSHRLAIGAASAVGKMATG